MVVYPEGEFETLIVRGKAGRFYAIPVKVLNELYARDLSEEKRRLLDALFSESRKDERAVDAFYYDRPVEGDSAAFQR